MPLITLDNISLRFSEKVILDEINATIHKGIRLDSLEEMARVNQLF